MHPLPHRYTVLVDGGPTDLVTVGADGLAEFQSSSPPEFDGPPGHWSPETLLCAAVADCFLLTFRAVARGSKFDWQRLECRVEGTLDRKDGPMRFTGFVTHATLRVPEGADVARGRHLLEKAEAGCLIANSLAGARELVAEVVAGG